MTQTDTQTTPRTGEQQANERAEQAAETHELAAKALEPTQGDYGPGAKPLDTGNPDYETTTDVLSDYWDRTEEAASDNDGTSGNQDAPRFQPQVGTIADPENLDDPDKRIDPAVEAQKSQEEAQQETDSNPDDSTQSEPRPDTTQDQQPAAETKPAEQPNQQQSQSTEPQQPTQQS